VYELRIAYDVDTTLGEANVRSYHDDIEDAAKAFVRCTAPCKQLLHLDDDDKVRFLNADQQRVVVAVADAFGYDVHEVEG
jgi:hypothetical protein